MKKGLIILSIFFVLVLSGVVYAACSTADNWVINVKDPLGVLLPSNPYSCTDTILYTAAVSQNCPSTSSCVFNFAMPANCGMRGLYKMSCSASTLCGADVNFYTCSYDDCSNCCTSGTSYVWLGDGNSHNCCGDNDEPDYWTANADTNNWCSGGFTACVSNSYYNNGDGNSFVCACGGATWNLGFGEVSPTTCCGDDAGEYVISAGVGPNACCNNANDCVDGIGICRAGTEVCNFNYIDEDCDGETDYDDADGNKGDSSCPVGVTNIVVSDSSPWDNSAITVDCTSTVAGATSVEASIDGVGACSFTGWAGNVASFSCNVGSANCPASASKTARCGIDTTKSYQSGADQTTNIDVQCSDCSTKGTQPTCEAVPTCEWCPECGGAGNRLTNGGDVCVNTGNCPDYACSLGVCGAACDAGAGCGATSCDTVTCLCNPDVSCNPDTYGNSNCCDDSLGLEPNIDTDNLVGDFAMNCVGASCYGVPFPFAEVVSVYDNLCCGDDSGEFFNYFNLHVDGCDDITVEECIDNVDDTTDKLCCNVAGDCVYSGQCLSAGYGPIDLDGDSVQGEYCSNSGTGTWLDCDVSQVSCESDSCGNKTWTNANWESPFGEYENIVDVECCGDDYGEFIRYRQVLSITDGTGATNVVTDQTDIACCPSPDACVFEGVCYMDMDVAVVEINDTCAYLTESACGTTENCEWHTDCIGESPIYNEECKIHDDVDRMTGHDNMGMCTSMNNCQEVEECRVMEWEFNEVPNIYDSTYKDKVFKDINQDSNLEICDPGEWIDPNTDKDLCEAMGGFWLGTACCGDIDPDPDCDGTFYGNVKDIDGINVENALITLIGTSDMFPGGSLNYSTTTDAFGDYNVDVTGNSTYDLIASKSNFNPKTIINQFVEMSSSKEVNFTMVSSYEQCEADCTYTDDEVCHAGCDGRVGCQFYTTGTKNTCNGIMFGWSVLYNVSHEVICCEGQPYRNQELRVISVDLDDEVETMIRLVRLVVLRGRPTKLIIDAFK